jgi:hypothetical protein
MDIFCGFKKIDIELGLAFLLVYNMIFCQSNQMMVAISKFNNEIL